MSLNSINKSLANNKLWALFSIIIIGAYLYPLLFNGGVFYVPTYDNLDSNVVWNTILAHSGQIWASNQTIVPNMMSGLPRLSYGSEFDIMLWLYYFLDPKTAFIVNEITVHIVAFISMYILLNTYVIKTRTYYQKIPVYLGSLYFALIPFWAHMGLSIPLLPLVTYSLLNIKNNRFSVWDWVLLLILPLYSSFIMIYMFYILFSGIYLIWDTISKRKINYKLLIAISLMGVVFLLSEYRLVESTFFNASFTSHRTEFEIFFHSNFMETYRQLYIYFLRGHLAHAKGLQYIVLILANIAMLLAMSKKRFNRKESMIIIILIAISFAVNIWDILLKNLYTMPIWFSFMIYIAIFHKNARSIAMLMLLSLIITILGISQIYVEAKPIALIFPILKTLNISRMAFISPAIMGVLLAYTSLVFIKKISYSHIVLVIFILFQIDFSMSNRYFKIEHTRSFASFEDYYAAKLFKKIKRDIGKPVDSYKVISYGIEPSVSLYNGLHTADGYSTNYPVTYKHKFRRINKDFLDTTDNKKNIYVADGWGSKLYIGSLPATIDGALAIKGVEFVKVPFNINGLCELNTDYLLSSQKLIDIPKLNLINSYIGSKHSWDIYLYNIDCEKSI